MALEINFLVLLIGEDTPDLKYKRNQDLKSEQTIHLESFGVHRGTEADLGYTKIGDSNLIMPGVMIAHDCVVGDENILVDNSALAGHVVLGDHVTLGIYINPPVLQVGLLLFYWFSFI